MIISMDDEQRMADWKDRMSSQLNRMIRQTVRTKELLQGKDKELSAQVVAAALLKVEYDKTGVIPPEEKFLEISECNFYVYSIN